MLLFIPSRGPGRVTRTVHRNPNILQLPVQCSPTVCCPFHLGEEQVTFKEGRNLRMDETEQENNESST